MPENKIIKTEYHSNTKVSIGDLVEIMKLDRNFLGSLVQNTMRKYIGKFAVVAKIISSKTFPICIKLNEYDGVLFVKDSEIRRF